MQKSSDFGLSWQIVPNILTDLLGDSDDEQAMLSMVKLDIAKLVQAAAG